MFLQPLDLVLFLNFNYHIYGGCNIMWYTNTNGCSCVFSNFTKHFNYKVGSTVNGIYLFSVFEMEFTNPCIATILVTLSSEQIVLIAAKQPMAQSLVAYLLSSTLKSFPSLPFCMIPFSTGICPAI